jgi:NAD(P)-dependent dehydrogenase (short-subunit alcohol dehydrogenase family)
MAGNVVLVTGASSGIGQACARHLAARGYCVYGTSRNAPQPAAATNGVTLLPMDVGSETSVERAVQSVLQREGRLDVVINNAGYGIAGAVEDTTVAEAQAQLDTNFFGVLRVCRAVLPVMRRQGSGCLINIGSMAGVVAIPFQGLYSASKFAVEGLTEALRHEVRPFGVRVVLVEPGDFRTGFTAQRQLVAAAAGSAYAERCRAAVAVMAADESAAAEPQAVARLIERIIETDAPRLRYLVGPAPQKFAVAVLRKLLPQKVFESAIARYYRCT